MSIAEVNHNCIHFKEVEKNVYIYLFIYVDDILIASKDKIQIQRLMIMSHIEFVRKDLGDAKKILGIEVE